MFGILTVKPTCAKLTYDTEVFGRMDPYVKVHVGSQSYKTKSANDMGKNPSWSDNFTFKINGERSMTFQIYDKDYGKDDYIGEGEIDFSVFARGRTISEWFPIYRSKKKDKKEKKSKNKIKKGKESGKIMFILEFLPQGMNMGMPPQGYPPQGYQPQGYQPQGYPPQGYPPQGYPPQGYPPQGYPPQGYPQGYPPQGYPPQGYPQGYPPQGFPPQGFGMMDPKKMKKDKKKKDKKNKY